jgi:Protein of unknown function (DUF4242)
MHNGKYAILLASPSTSTLEESSKRLRRNPKEDVMKKYMIEREIPKIGTLGREHLQQGAAKSNQVLRQLGPDIQWLESFVTANKMYCMYLAADEGLIRKHAELSGFPATKVTEIGETIDPTTAASG